MQDLVGHIRNRLADKKYCTIFQNHLETAFPVREANEELKTVLEKFAAQHGWSVKITDSGIRATFRPLTPALETVPIPVGPAPRRSRPYPLV